jgi:copper resistance protein C
MRVMTFVISALLSVVLGAVAEAHAFLDHAEPRVGSTVPTAPRQLSLSFTQNLEPAFSSVEVSDANGARVDLGKPSISTSVMRVGLSNWLREPTGSVGTFCRSIPTRPRAALLLAWDRESRRG